MINFFNRFKGGRDSSSLNVFTQFQEPTKKQGIWLKTNKYTAEHYINDNDIFTSGTWISNLSTIPYNFNGALASIGNTVYLFGSQSDGTMAYKYDILTNTYTRLSNIPYDFNGGAAVAVGTDIYLFGSSNNSYNTMTYKYDTLTDTYTQLTNIPYNINGGAAVAVGTDIYLYCGYRITYKYDTLTDTYTSIGTGSMPPQWLRNRCVAIGTDIWGCRKW